MPYIIISLASFFINVPLGYIRENTPKFSPSWFFWIHASIPLIIYLRLTLHTSAWFIPMTIFFAVYGQIAGSQLRKKRMTVKDMEVLEQIGDLDISNPEGIEDTKVLVALLNMGGPRTNKDVKDFQKHLFSDPLLIRFPLSFALQKFFAWMLIKFRLKAVESRYNDIGGGSPIYKSTTAQARALRKELKKRGRNIDVTFSFNYSPPFSNDTVAKANRAKKDYLLPISLYPHYSKATTGSNIHYLQKSIDESDSNLELLKATPYYLHNGYINAFTDRIHEVVKAQEKLSDFYLLFSAHGLPLYFLKEGDPYPFQITQTVSKILSKLNRDSAWSLSYQSSVGPLQWLKPATGDMLKALARRGIKKIIVVPVSFVSDHIETIHEIDIEYREEAEQVGITDLRMSKAIECHPGFIHALADTIEKSVLKPQREEVQNEKNAVELTNQGVK